MTFSDYPFLFHRREYQKIGSYTTESQNQAGNCRYKQDNIKWVEPYTGRWLKYWKLTQTNMHFRNERMKKEKKDNHAHYYTTFQQKPSVSYTILWMIKNKLDKQPL